MTGSVITITKIKDLGNGSFRWSFSDGTNYTTPDLRGGQGPAGKEGQKGQSGDKGVGIHHIRLTGTTDPNGVFSSFGELDTYTFYGDASEEYVLGWFSIRNGSSGQEGGSTSSGSNDRSKHTGEQAISTVTGLTAELANKVSKDGTKQLSDENFTLELKEAIEEMSDKKFKGLYTSLEALEADQLTGEAGDFAHVDLGVGKDVTAFIYDVSDGKWVQQAGKAAALTATEVRDLFLANTGTEEFTTAFKEQLEGTEVGATKNSTDEELRDRTSHTGMQDMATVTGLVEGLADKVTVEVGKGLSEENYTTADKEALDALVLANEAIPVDPKYTDTVYDDTALDARVEVLETVEYKTINGETIIGVGDIIIESGGLDESQLKAFLVGLEDGTLSGDEYVVMVNREQDTVTRYSLNDLISTITSLVDTSGGGSGLDFEDRQKIDSIAFEATKNETDGYLLNRANHTGTISMSAVENLDQTLANIELGGMTAGETLRIDGIESSLVLKADLDGSGKLLASQLPDIASGRKIKVANADARLLVDAHLDLTIAYQMDDGTSWAINGGDDPSNPDNWTELGSALISGVTSFNTRTGNIMPQAGDYTAEMVTETDEKQFVTAVDKVSWNNRVPDAPFNGQIYGRKNGEWIIVTGGGGTGSLSPQKEEELLERSNHTGTQGMETIDGLADVFNTKADIDTVYAVPMQTSYTIRTVDSTENQVHTFLLNGTNNSFGIHAYALRMTPSTADSYSLETTIQPGGYYGVKIPRVSGITIEPTGQGSEPYQRMTRHEEHGQTVTATSEYSANYTVWKMFQAGDTPLGESDNWVSSRAATPTDPQVITLTLPNAVKLGSYAMVPYGTASPRTWTFEGRRGDESDWNILHTVTDEASVPRRDYTIPTSNQGTYDQYRWVITGSNNGGSYFYIARMFLYTAPAKFMIKDGDTFYNVESAVLAHLYEPMTNYQQHGQTAFGSTEHDANYRYWKAFQEGYATGAYDCWISSAAPTTAAPQHVGIDLGGPKFLKMYKFQNRVGGGTSPSSWTIQVRNSLLDDWVVIHTVRNDIQNGSGVIREFTIPSTSQGEWRYVRIVVTEGNGGYPYVAIARFKLYGGGGGEELTPLSGITGPSGITVNGTVQQVAISQGAMETLSEPYIVTDEPFTVNFSIDPESEYEYTNDTKITLASSYIRFSPTVAGSYKFCYQEPTN